MTLTVVHRGVTIALGRARARTPTRPSCLARASLCAGMADDAGKFARGIAPHVALVATGVAAGLTAQQLWPDVKQAVSDLCSNLTDRATAHFTAKNKELVTAAMAAPHEDGLSMHNVVSRHVSDAREVRMPAVNSTAQTTSGSAQGKRPVSSRANSTRHDMRLRADTEMSEDDDDDDDEIAALKQQLADAEKRKRAKKSTTVTGAVQASQVDPPTPARKMPSRASAGRAETRWKGMLDADKRVDPQETVQAADVVEAATPSSPATGAAGGNNDLSEHSHAGSDIAGANADDGNDQVNEKLLGMLKLASDDLKAAAATGEVDKLVDGAPGWVVSWKPRATVDHAKGDVYFKYGDGTHPPLRSIKDVERFLTTHGNGFSCDPPPDAQLPPPHVALLTPIPMGFDAAKLEHRLYFQGATIKVWWSADVCEKPGWFKATVTDVGNDPEVRAI